ncbi:MAG: hypothetical protein J6T70_15175 [Bacteroidales bacterium]|nr:hypothetical protein [Bacteroidales bacterium]
METKLNIIIGQGLGPLQFGATEEDIKDIFGAPDETENDKESNTLTLFYDGIMTDFVLEPDEEDETYRLSSILTSNPDYSIDNKIQFGDSEEALIKYAKTLKAENPETETDTETNEKYLYFDDLNLVAIFDQEGLASVQISAWDEDDEE